MESLVLMRSEAEASGMETFEPAEPLVQTAAGGLSLHVTSDLQRIKPVWTALQAATPCTVAQTFDWGRAWSEHMLAPAGGVPAVAIGYGTDGAAKFLLPFETKQLAGMTVLKWLGQDHANYSFGLFAAGIAPLLTKNDVSCLLRAIARRTGAAAAYFEAQPFSWQGVPNPFALLSHQLAPNSGFAIELGDFQTLYLGRFKKRARQALLRKERRLQEAGPLHYGWAETDEQKRGVLDAFFEQKAQQFAAMGVTDIFGPEAQGFYRDLAALPAGNPSRLRLGYVALDGDILATFSGAVCHDRMCVLLSSLTSNEHQRQSPGAQLLRHQIEEACSHGLKYFDLGVGGARHKSEWSNVVYPLFDSYIALKPQGHGLTLPRAATAQLKRIIKTNPRLWALAQSVRKRINARDA